MGWIRMANNKLYERLKEFTLIMLYLNSWEENEFGMKYRRSWKGYDFDILNELSDEGLIGSSYRSKSVSIGDEGVEKAKELLKKFGLNEFLNDAQKENKAVKDRIFDNNDKLVGAVQWDSDSEEGLPKIHINGKSYSWVELGKKVMTHEGFNIKIEFSDPSDEG